MELTTRLQRAINRACALHDGKKRKGEGNLPYISHLWSVYVILTKYTDNEDVFIGGIMHDVVKDIRGYNYHDLGEDIGWEIADLVREISEFDNDKIDKKATWTERKMAFLKKLETASEESLMICAADKIHNIKSTMDCYDAIGEEAFKNFDAPIEKKLWFYEEVLKVLQLRLQNDIVIELMDVCQKARLAIEAPI
ncbi:MAG: HD domain-containing protein [Candidatus Falkowbacteria bacterium]